MGTMDGTGTVIPVGGGKGGVGKTFITANLAVALAQAGHSTIAVDMDLGGSNLHSFLGLANRCPGIGDFLKARTGELDELLVPTPFAKLRFLAGDGRSPFMANITYAQKKRLLSRLERLPAEYILLDLGSGTSFNTLDFFGLSNRGLLITTPEYPSLMNTLSFLKLHLLRLIERRFSGNQYVRDLLQSRYKRPLEEQISSIQELRDELAALSSETGREVERICSQCRPRVVFNMGDHPDELLVARQVKNSLADILSIEADFFGFVFRDSAVRESLNSGVPLLANGNSIAGNEILKIAQRISKFWTRPVRDSLDLLVRHARHTYQQAA